MLRPVPAPDFFFQAAPAPGFFFKQLRFRLQGAKNTRLLASGSQALQGGIREFKCPQILLAKSKGPVKPDIMRVQRALLTQNF